MKMTFGENAIFPAPISGVASRKRKYHPTNSTEARKKRAMSLITDTMEVIYSDIFDLVNYTTPGPATAPPFRHIEQQPQAISETFTALTDSSKI